MQSSSSLLPLESYLKLTGMREQVIAANMANVDTPGYRTQDIDFTSELNKAMNEGEQRTQLTTATAQTTPVAYEVNGLLERADGNNVNLDREGTLLAVVQLQHQMSVQLIKHHFHGLLSVINGGQS